MDSKNPIYDIYLRQGTRLNTSNQDILFTRNRSQKSAWIFCSAVEDPSNLVFDQFIFNPDTVDYDFSIRLMGDDFKLSYLRGEL